MSSANPRWPSPSLRSRLHVWALNWLHLYEAVRAVMGYSFEEDLWAARVLEARLWDAWQRGAYVGVEELCGVLRGERVCVVGLSEDAESLWGLGDCVIAAADGAARLLMERGVVPDIVFTDLDGGVKHLVEASERGSIVVVHSHGDNYPLVSYAVPVLSRVHGTVQVLHPLTRLATVLGGFTDGDRAVATAVLCGARRVTLYGMAFWRRVSGYSKPWLKAPTRPGREKRAKLLIAAILLAYLTRLARATGTRIEWAGDEGILRR